MKRLRIERKLAIVKEQLKKLRGNGGADVEE